MQRTHPFGELLSQLRARKHGLTQARLAALAGYDPAVVARMAQGQKDLTGTQARERVLRLIRALDEAGVLYAPEDADALLQAAGMPPLFAGDAAEAALLDQLVLHRRSGTDELQKLSLAPRHNLPAQFTSFIGREREITQIRQLLASARLVTLNGPGGVGKTRLAIEAASTLGDAFPDGVWWLSLAAMSDPAQITPALLDLFELHPRDEASPLRVLVDFLLRRRLLLVLDNCEHLVDACADLVAHLLGRCPALCILTTSREALQVPGELALRVPPLATPVASAVEPDEALAFDAVQLFVARAQAAQPAFVLTAGNADAVAQVCERLDGIPLALELAAALLQVMSVEEIAARIDNRFALLNRGPRAVPARHQALSNTVDWSYALLTPAEQTLLARLSAFAGGWTLGASEAICAGATSAGALQREDVLPALRQLVNKSLVVIDERSAPATRYRLLKTIQEYAAGKLRERGEQDMTQNNHLEYMLRLAEDANAQMHAEPPQDQAAWNRLIEHQDELRAALTHAEQSGNAEALLRLVTALQPFWVGRGLRTEGTLWMQKALAAGQAAPERLRAALMFAWAWTFSSDADALKQLAPEAEACLAACRAEGDQAGIAQALTVLGGSASASGAFAKAQASFKEALSIFEAMGDRRAIHNVRHQIGNALQQEDSAAAEAWMLESIQRYSDAGEDRYLSTALADLAWLIEERDPRDPRLVPLWRRSVQAASDAGDAGDADLQSEFLYMLGLAEVAAGDRAQAGEHLAQSLQIGCDMGGKGGIEFAAKALRDVDPKRAEAILKDYLLRRQEAGDKEGIAQAMHVLELVQL